MNLFFFTTFFFIIQPVKWDKLLSPNTGMIPVLTEGLILARPGLDILTPFPEWSHPGNWLWHEANIMTSTCKLMMTLRVLGTMTWLPHDHLDPDDDDPEPKWEHEPQTPEAVGTQNRSEKLAMAHDTTWLMMMVIDTLHDGQFHCWSLLAHSWHHILRFGPAPALVSFSDIDKCFLEILMTLMSFPVAWLLTTGAGCQIVMGDNFSDLPMSASDWSLTHCPDFSLVHLSLTCPDQISSDQDLWRH